MTTVSIITPTIGRDSLKTMLDKLVPQLEDGDEVLVIGDGPQPNAKHIIDLVGDPLVKYSELGPIWNYGNPQRNLGIEQAKGDYIMFVDDDDVPCPDAIQAIKQAAQEFPGKPFMFRMQHPGLLLWRDTEVRMRNVSGQMFVPPNDKAKIGRWSGRYEADYDFITTTLGFYPENSLVWRQELITIQGFAGRGNIGREILS